MPLGPSHSEAVFYFGMPFVIAVVLVVLLLTRLRRFFALIGALVSFVVYVATGFAALHNVFGVMMLLFSGWVAVAFLLFALYFSTQGATRLRATISGFTHFLLAKKRYIILLIAAGIGLLVVGPKSKLGSAQNVEDARRFCESIGSRATSSDIETLASGFIGLPIYVERDRGTVSVARVGLCKCSISISETGTTVRPLVCDG